MDRRGLTVREGIADGRVCKPGWLSMLRLNKQYLDCRKRLRRQVPPPKNERAHRGSRRSARPGPAARRRRQRPRTCSSLPPRQRSSANGRQRKAAVGTVATRRKNGCRGLTDGEGAALAAWDSVPGVDVGAVADEGLARLEPAGDAAWQRRFLVPAPGARTISR